MGDFNKDVLIVIPARGGSKGIPRKNLRHFNGVPLLVRIINTCRNFHCIVSSDDDEIIQIAKLQGVKTHKRSSKLSNDSATLDEVIYDVVNQTNKDWKAIITVQPTSPLLKTSSLINALNKFIASEVDTLVSVVNDTHLRWKCVPNGFEPLYEERLNRQYLPLEYKETGAIVICRKEILTTTRKRFGKKVTLFEISKQESIDIDDYQDWIIAETLDRPKKVLTLITKGNQKIGSGHIYNCLSIASLFGGYEIKFLLSKDSEGLADIIKSRNFSLSYYHNEEIDNYNFNDSSLIILDMLDIPKEFIEKIKLQTKCPIVSFENTGDSIEICDLTFNPIYKLGYFKSERVIEGISNFILRDEFLYTEKYKYRSEVNSILIAYGGVDPNDLTVKTLEGIYGYCNTKGINITVLLGKAYLNRKYIEQKYPKVLIKQNVYSVSEIMSSSDIAFTSSGRTSIELAHLHVPCIISAQNTREENHHFSSNEFAIYLGLGEKNSSTQYYTCLKSILERNKLRLDIHIALQKLDLSRGALNVKNQIMNIL